LNDITHTQFKIDQGIYISPSAEIKFADFEKNYLEVREKEKRVLGIDEIRKLPYVELTSPDYGLWKTRRHNINRFLKYLQTKKPAYPRTDSDEAGGTLKILDVGCGNGFFTNLMQIQGHQVTGLDVNLVELKQAVEAFGSSKITWVYADIFSDQLPGNKFDIITFCCSFQYFKNPAQLLKLCKELLNPDGEIHIIDSPFYSENEIEAAQSRSKSYFHTMGTQNMHKYYHHNSYRVLEGYNVTFNYKPNKLRARVFKDSPFPWIVIR
jgi:ubiquinone/menaquinone biosynthesis C-methylase UbiE